MIESVISRWPIFYSGSKVSIDDSVLKPLAGIMGGESAVENMLEELPSWKNYSAFNPAWNGPAGLLPYHDLARVLVAIALANKGVMSIPDGEGIPVMWVLARLKKMDVLKAYVEYNMNKEMPPEIVFGLGAIRQIMAGDVQDVEEMLVKACQTRTRSMYCCSEAEEILRDGLLSLWRKTLFEDDPLFHLERSIEEYDGTRPPDGTPWKKRLMWMCADPYKRMIMFDRPELVKTIERIKARFPFSLPLDLDLETRSPKEIVAGLRRLLDDYGLIGVAMDPRKTLAAVNAYRRLCSMSPATAEERRNGVAMDMAGFCLYDSNPVDFLEKALSRGVGSDHSLIRNIRLFLHHNVSRNLLTYVLVALERSMLAGDFCITPVYSVYC